MKFSDTTSGGWTLARFPAPNHYAYGNDSNNKTCTSCHNQKCGIIFAEQAAVIVIHQRSPVAVRDPGVEHPGLPAPARPGRLPHVGRGGSEGGVGVQAALSRGGAALGGEQTGPELSTNLSKVSQCPGKPRLGSSPCWSWMGGLPQLNRHEIWTIVLKGHNWQVAWGSLITTWFRT